MKYRLLLGISGGIAAYKCCELVRLLKKNNIDVKVVLTETAKQFVSPYSLEVLSENLVYTDQATFTLESPHLSLSKWADLFLIAPATANTLSKCSLGIADSLLTTLWLTFNKQKLVAPAMHTEMWEQPSIQRNISRLKEDGVRVVGPVSGELACGDTGIGRMVEPSLLVDYVLAYFKPALPLFGKKIVITAGGTEEAIDDVRVISNLSSGKMGHAIADLASYYGADVTLVTTKSKNENPLIQSTQKVKSVSELKAALETVLSQETDMLIMSAAVSDFTVQKSEKKIKRSSQSVLDLIPTSDILQGITEKMPDLNTIGFCLESEQHLLEVAYEKLMRKQLSFIIANTSENLGSDFKSFYILKKGQKKPIKTVKDASLLDSAHQILSLIQ